MFKLLLSVQILSALLVVIFVLLQKNRDANIGSMFGGNSSGSIFGASGAANFLSQSTKWASIVFFSTTVTLAWITHKEDIQSTHSSIMQDYTQKGLSTSPEIFLQE